MPFFVKKPIPIEAHQWFRNGDHPEDHAPIGLENPTYIDLDRYWEYCQTEGKIVGRYRSEDHHPQHTCNQCGCMYQEHGWIKTLEGGHIVCPGDWVITGIRGERYPCKPDIFAQTYDQLFVDPSSFDPVRGPVHGSHGSLQG